MGVTRLKSFQIVQESLGLVRVKVVPYDPARPPSLETLRQNLCAVIGDGTQIDIELCESIPPAASGKPRFIISKVTDV
jgi:hypothetical protein